MKIAVYSGSFNPLHIGHKAILEYLSEEAFYDMVYLVVTPQNPFKSSDNLKTGDRRFELAVEAVARYPQLKVKADDVEQHLDPPYYTIRTLRTLKEREQDNEFTLVIGADSFSNIRKWKEYKAILAEFGVVVYPREGYDMEEIREGLLEENPEYRIRLIDAPIVDISSTMIREGIESGEDMSAYLM